MLCEKDQEEKRGDLIIVNGKNAVISVFVGKTEKSHKYRKVNGKRKNKNC